MTTLQDICHLITDGKHGDCRNEDDSGFYFVSCKDVRDGYIDYSGARQITKSDFLDTHKRTQLEANDIVITNSGTIGRMALMSNAPETNRTTFQKSVAIVKPNQDKVVPRWLYYLLMAKRDVLIAWAGGTAQKNLLLRDMRAFKIDVPSLSTQRKIAAVLSGYDDLIENNTRRIEILEAMARAIYRAWFVEFRFPGHENAKMVDSELGSIPEGWEATKLGDVLDTIESGSRPKGGIDPDESEVPSIGAGNILGLGKYDYSKDSFISQEYFESMRRGIVNDQDVLIYKDGANLGRKALFRDGFPHEICSINSHVYILRSGEKCTQSYLYFWLDLPKMTSAIKNLNTNAAQPGINQKKVKSLPILIPDQHTISLFERTIEPILKLLFNLAKRDVVLAKTRDILLPKLVSGQVDVSELEIAF